MLLSQGVQLIQEETSTRSLKHRLGMLSLPAKSKVFCLFFTSSIFHRNICGINESKRGWRQAGTCHCSPNQPKSWRAWDPGRQMPLTVEGWRAEQEEAPNEWLLLVPKPKMGPTKKGSWSGWGTSLLLESCNKNDGLGGPPPHNSHGPRTRAIYTTSHSSQMNGLILL